KAYADEYFLNAESQERGGWYPIGINQTWHGGIHLTAKCGTPVRAMFDGVVVAARFSPKPTALGHNNFIVVKRTMPIPGKTKHSTPKDFIFYSVYMHLLPMELRKEELD